MNGTGDRDYLLWGNRKGYSDNQVLRSVAAELGSFLKEGDPNIDPKIIYYNPYYGDPPKGTPNFGKPSLNEGFLNP